MATRIVNGTIRDAEGNALTGKISFELIKGFADTEVIAKTQVNTQVGSDGTFSITLQSGESANYICIMPNLERFEFALPDSVDPLDIATVR